MKIGNFNGIIKLVQSIATKHGPEILIGLGIAGMGTTVVLSVKATPKALLIIDDAINEKNDIELEIANENEDYIYNPIDKLTVMETTKVCWKCYLPAVITGVTSVVCIIGGTTMNLRRNAALATAYKISETAIKELQEYKDKVVDTIGEEKNQEIENKINKEHLDRAAVDLDSTTISGTGPVLYFEKMGGQWFKSDKETVREVINNLNNTMNTEMYVSLNDFYADMGLANTIAGDSLGWNTNQGMIEPRFSSMVTKTGIPVVVLTTRIEPRVDYGKLY